MTIQAGLIVEILKLSCIAYLIEAYLIELSGGVR